MFTSDQISILEEKVVFNSNSEITFNGNISVMIGEVRSMEGTVSSMFGNIRRTLNGNVAVMYGNVVGESGQLGNFYPPPPVLDIPLVEYEEGSFELFTEQQRLILETMFSFGSRNQIFINGEIRIVNGNIREMFGTIGDMNGNISKLLFGDVKIMRGRTLSAQRREAVYGFENGFEEDLSIATKPLVRTVEQMTNLESRSIDNEISERDEEIHTLSAKIISVESDIFSATALGTKEALDLVDILTQTLYELNQFLSEASSAVSLLKSEKQSLLSKDANYSFSEDPDVEDTTTEDTTTEDTLAEDTLAEDPYVEDTLTEEPYVEEPYVEEPYVEDDHSPDDNSPDDNSPDNYVEDNYVEDPE